MELEYDGLVGFLFETHEVECELCGITYGRSGLDEISDILNSRGKTCKLCRLDGKPPKGAPAVWPMVSKSTN